VKAVGEIWPWLGIAATFAVIAGVEAGARRRKKQPPDVSRCDWAVPDPVPAAVTVRAVELLARGDPLGTEYVEEVQGRIYRFRRAMHPPNAQIPEWHPGIDAVECTQRARRSSSSSSSNANE
jgi:hypothetical protein